VCDFVNVALTSINLLTISKEKECVLLDSSLNCSQMFVSNSQIPILIPCFLFLPTDRVARHKTKAPKASLSSQSELPHKLMSDSQMLKISTFFHSSLAVVGQGFLIVDSTITHTRKDSSSRVIGPSQRPLPNNKQSQETIFKHPAGFEPAIPASYGPQTHALDSAAKGIGRELYLPDC
jgi:hypothetical protein